MLLFCKLCLDLLLCIVDWFVLILTRVEYWLTRIMFWVFFFTENGSGGHEHGGHNHSRKALAVLREENELLKREKGDLEQKVLDVTEKQVFCCFILIWFLSFHSPSSLFSST